MKGYKVKDNKGRIHTINRVGRNCYGNTLYMVDGERFGIQKCNATILTPLIIPHTKFKHKLLGFKKR